MSEAMLTVRGVETFYGKIQALKGVDIDVAKGEIVALIGSNGAGKSTLMMTICGTPRARAGNITFADNDITQMPTHEIIRLGIAQSPEGRRIFPRMTVLENLQMGAAVSDPVISTRISESVFKMFPILEKRQAQRGGTLSGGEQQMLAIARALMARPRLLLLDEPSLGLAPLIVKQIFSAIRELNAKQGLDRVSGRAECLSRTQARPSRLCHGQRPDHDERHRQGASCQGRDPRRLSRRRPLSRPCRSSSRTSFRSS